MFLSFLTCSKIIMFNYWFTYLYCKRISSTGLTSNILFAQQNANSHTKMYSLKKIPFLPSSDSYWCHKPLWWNTSLPSHTDLHNRPSFPLSPQNPVSLWGHFKAPTRICIRDPNLSIHMVIEKCFRVVNIKPKGKIKEYHSSWL